MLELFGMFVLALAPIIWLVIALCGLRMEAYLASIGALVVAGPGAAGGGGVPARREAGRADARALAGWGGAPELLASWMKPIFCGGFS